MQIQISEVFRLALAFLAGGLIGLAFGTIQDLAYVRNQRRQQKGDLNSGWAVMPGSMRRVAYLLVALALVQFLCPLLFVGVSQWCVSGGVVFGYGWVLFRRLMRTRAANL